MSNILEPNLGPIDYDQLNPGIRGTVRLLRESGYDTRDSGDGRTHQFECDLDIPYVHIVVRPIDLIDAADRIRDLLVTKGLDFSHPYDDHGNNDGPNIEANYSPESKLATVSVLGVDDQLLGL